MFEIAAGRSKIETWGPKFDKCSQVMVYAGDVVLRDEDYWMLKITASLVEQKIRWD
jgi:hypothetical protein